jgi:ribose transport system ATP-binding protein
MDEPTASLTPAETERLLDVARDLRDTQGVSIIYISHRLNEIITVADRVTGLRDGKNAGDLPKGEITQERMVRLMVGRDIRRERTEEHENANAPIRLEVRGLRTRRYPAREASFQLRAGEILGFAGLVGAGRTEVAESVFGITPPLSGDIFLNGKPLTVRKPDDAITAGIALIPEDRRRHGLILSLPIRENISLPSLLRFARPSMPLGLVNTRAERTVAEDAAKRADVRSAAGTIEAAAGTLSGGNQQKIVLAKWLARDPQVMILDEPTRGVDVGAKAQIYERIRALAREQNVAVWVISSDMEEVLTLCDRIAVMHEGAITGILPHREATEEAIMRLAVGEK